MPQGDHLRARRDGGWDHAIDLGDRTVIRWIAGRGVQRCTAADFAAGSGPVELVVHRERVFRPAVVVARAFSRFAEAAYDAMFRSPEQFATWCKNGQMGEPPAVAPPRKPTSRRAAAGVARKTALRRAKRPAPRKAAPPRRAPRRARRQARRRGR
jgi:hypothetical protein